MIRTELDVRASMLNETRKFVGSIRGDTKRPRWYSTALVRLLRASGLVALVFIIGTVGFYVLADYKQNLLQCAYMTAITLSTVGFEETIPIGNRPSLEVFSIFLIIFGTGTVLYFASALTAFIVDGELRNLIRSRRMAQRIDELRDHFIVAGIGSTGEYVLSEIRNSKKACVVIDADRERIKKVSDDLDMSFPYIVGDATEDDILKEAGLDRARAIICSLGNDRDNLFVTVSARTLNSDIRIITRGSHTDSIDKFKRAGANSVIYTNVLGGARMAAEAIRPEVTTFLDLTMQDHDHVRRVEEIPIPENSPVVGHELKDTPIRRLTDALIIAVYDCDLDEYFFNPGPDYVLTEDTKLIVLTLVEDIPTIEGILRGEDGW